MSFEFGYWAQDLRRYLVEWRNRAQLREEGAGVDYTDEKYHAQNARAVSRIHPKRMSLRVLEVIEETPTTKTFRFERTDAPLPPFRAGQYVNLFLSIDGVRTSRPYSMSSAPGKDFLDLTVRSKPGGFVSNHLLNTTRPGDEFVSSGPAGHFHYEPLIDRGELVLLAGGSGITPFMSLIRHHAELDWPTKIHLIYGSRTMDEVIFGEEFDALNWNNPELNYALALSEPYDGYDGVRGFITADLIESHCGGIEGKTFMICGPNAMYDFVLGELAKLNVPRHKIRRELYGPPEPVTEQPNWPKRVKADTLFNVEIVGKRTIQAPAGEPLMNSLERNGLVLPAVCRSGACSKCRVQLALGQVYMPPTVGLRESDRANGYIHACVSYPLEDLKIRI